MQHNISLVTDYTRHTMENSLKDYLKIKMHHLLLQNKPKHIHIVGEYNRNNVISVFEKTGKMINWKRPTAEINGDTIILKSFPGFDYVEHYANIVGSYFAITKECSPTISYDLPSNEECYRALYQSNLPEIKGYDYVIIGTVEHLRSITNHAEWVDNGDFIVSANTLPNKSKVALVGCKFSIWGDIAGRVVDILAHNQNKNVIYVGKVGGMKPSLVPNKTLATGAESLLNNKIIQWDNLFADVQLPTLVHGIHVNSHSILAEDKYWHKIFHMHYDFVDPEIGHMAAAAKAANIGFGFIHIISNNLATVYAEDLSNERKDEVRAKRHQLLLHISQTITGLVNA